MLGQIWATLQFLRELWAQLLVFIGMVEKKKHEDAVKEINDAAGTISSPDTTEKGALDATQDLENQLNKHTS